MRILSGVLFAIYIVIGVVVAQANNYLTGLDSIESIVSAVLAILLWPLVLLGIDLKIGEGSIDETPEGGGSGGGGSVSRPGNVGLGTGGLY